MSRQQDEHRERTEGASGGGRSFNLEALDREILDRLQEGARTQAYILNDLDAADADQEADVDYSRAQIRERFKILHALGAVRKLHDQTALYELVYDPRDDGSD